ncbi:hypothetical protein KIPB_013778, partial [Kipferlia bialata]
AKLFAILAAYTVLKGKKGLDEDEEEEEEGEGEAEAEGEKDKKDKKKEKDVRMYPYDPESMAMALDSLALILCSTHAKDNKKYQQKAYKSWKKTVKRIKTELEVSKRAVNPGPYQLSSLRLQQRC